jgi:ParB family transcriptional regulator, chromosome partitioning protein
MATPVLMQMNKVTVAEVIEKERLRPVSEAGVESLIASITETGVMKDAIHVRQKKDGKFYLIAGGHRLEAARRLGWEEIEAKVWTNVTDDWARLMEIDDNLAGAEMNALDTAVFLATRKEVYERLHPETRAGVFKGNQHTGNVVADMMSVTSFARATAEKFGLTDRHVRRMIAAGNALGPDQISALRRAPRAVSLKDLAEIAKIGDPAERYDVVRFLSEGTAKSASEARSTYQRRNGNAPPPKDPIQEAFNVLLTAWKRAPMAAKRRFMAEKGDEIAPLLSKGDVP